MTVGRKEDVSSGFFVRCRRRGSLVVARLFRGSKVRRLESVQHLFLVSSMIQREIREDRGRGRWCCDWSLGVVRLGHRHLCSATYFIREKRRRGRKRRRMARAAATAEGVLLLLLLLIIMTTTKKRHHRHHHHHLELPISWSFVGLLPPSVVDPSFEHVLVLRLLLLCICCGAVCRHHYISSVVFSSCVVGRSSKIDFCS